MLTRLLHQCGLELGPESELMPAQADNPDGFWENLRFVALNDEILNELGGAWDLPPAADADFEDARLDPLRTKAQLLIDEFDPLKLWGWKDPRNSVTLPFWRRLLPGCKVVMMVRNPLEVAYSMQKRNGTSYSFGLRLWEIYNRRLIGSTSSSERLVCHYDSFFGDPKAELERVVRFIGLPLSLISDAAALVTQKRRHTHFTTEQLIDSRASAEVVELYRRLMNEAGPALGPRRGNTPAVAPIKSKSPNTDPLSGAISRLNVSIANAETTRRELAHLRGADVEAEKLRVQLRQAAEELARREGRLQEMERNAVRQEDARSALQQQLQESALLAARLRQQIGILEAESRDLRERFVEINQRIQDKSISLAESEARATEVTGNLRHQLQATKKLSRFLDDVEAAASKLRSSRRWKIANPVAAIKAALFPKRRLLGYGHLEKVVSAYAKWRAAHPEVEEIDNAIQSLIRRGNASVPLVPTGGLSAEDRSANQTKPRPPTEPIEFAVHEEVEISIIIPVFNQFEHTHACLASLQRHAGAERFEVVVVDDASTDATAKMILKIPGVIYVRNETNLGFIASCNKGAKRARGSFLVFLNNDTEITPGWLGALRETFELEPRAGLVGSKLIYPDGRLQEAGGIIWRDGSGWNRGRLDDPEKPEYNFLREVDYCSAASVMIPRTLFESLGGFDSKYAPGYYEDTDLAFKIRRHGLKVFYQPLSEVIHYEGATGGTDLSTGAKKHQQINRETFAETWAETLAQKPVNGDLAANERLGPGRKRILVIDNHLPMPDRDSGSMRMFQILKILHALGHSVTFIPDNLADIPPYGSELRRRGIEVVHHPFVKTVREYLQTHGSKFDVVVLSRCDFARKHIADVRACAPQSRIIFDTVDLHFLRENREADLLQDPEIKRMALERQQQEYELIEQADQTWVVSVAEQEVLRQARPGKSIQVVSNIVDIPGSATPFSLRRDFLFIGSFQHTPNVDAVIYFTREIYPLAKEQLNGAKFYIIGDKAPPAVVALGDENVVVTGLQPDIRPYFENVRLSIAPLRFGAGVKGKINQSMGFGVPVVASSLAVEGMSLSDREDVLVADTPEDFARALIEVYQSEALWERISKGGLEKTRALYSTEVARKILSRLISEEALESFDAASDVAASGHQQRAESIHLGAAT